MRPGGRSAIVLRISLLLALVACLAGGIAALRRVLDAEMAEVRDTLLSSLQSRLGRTITYGQVSPSVFGRLAITDLRIYSATDPGRVVLSVDHLRASYSLLRLLLTREPMQALREINLSDSVLTLDIPADREIFSALLKLAREPASPGGKPFSAPATLRVSGSELSVRFVSEAAQVSVSRLFFSVSGGEKWLTLSLRCGLAGTLAVQGPLAGSFQSRIEVSGKAAPDLAWADLDLVVRSFVHDRIALRDQTFLLSYRDGVLELTKIEDRAPVDLKLEIGTVSGTAKLTFRTDALRASELFTLRGEWTPAMEWLAHPVSARGSVSLNLDGSGLAYEAEVQTVLSHPLLPADLAVSAEVSGDASSLIVRSLSVESSAGSLDFTGDIELSSFLPQGQATVRGLESLLGRRVEGSFTVERSPPAQGLPRRLRASSAALDIGSTSLRELRVDLAMRAGGADVSLSAGLAAPGSARMPTTALAGSVSWKPEPRIGLAGSVEAITLGAVLSALSPGQEAALGPSIGAMVASGSLRLVTDLKTFSVDIPAVVVTDPANPANRASGSFSWAKDTVSIRSLELSYLGQSLSGAADVEIASGRAVAFRSSFSLNGVPFDVGGSLEANDLRFTGSYGIEGALATFPFETDRRDMYFWIRSTAMPIPLAGLPVTATLDLKGAFPDGEEWFVTSTRSRASIRLPGSAAPVEAEMDFVLNRSGVTFERLSLSDSVSTVSGAGSVAFVDLSRPAVAVSLRFRGAKSAEQYSVDGNLSPQDMQLRASVAGSPLARLGQSLVTGSFRGTATLAGSPAAPQINASVALENGRFNRDPITLAADISASPSRLSLRNVRFGLGSHRLTEGEASFDVPTGAFALGGRYDAELLADQVRLRVGASGTLEGYSLAELSAFAFPESMNATLTVSEATVNAVPFPPWSVQIRSQGDALAFSGGPGGILEGRLGKDQRIGVRLKDPFPLVGSIDGSLEGSRLNATLAVDRLDIKVLSTLLKSDIVQFTGGTAAGSVTIYGPLNDPDIVGSMRVSGATVKTPLSPDPVTGVNTYVSFGPGQTTEEEKVFILDTVTAPMGKGKISAAARFTLDHWAPTAFDLKLTAEPPEGVRIVWRFGTLAVDGFVRGTARIVHDGTRTEISSSDLVVQSSRLTLDWSDSGTDAGGEPPPLSVDLRIATGRNVQFFWPSQVFPILKATARQGSVLKVVYDGEADELIMEGVADVLAGTLFFFDRSFSIREGSIAFQENKLQFDPRVSVRAEIRERDAENRDYRIFLEAERVRLSEFSTQTIRFSSDPALPSAVILERIGQSIFSRTAAGAGSAEGTAALPLFASLTGDVISQVGLLSPIEDRVRDFLGLDLVSIRTQLVQNFLVDKILSQGGGLDNNGPALGKYFGNTELTIGKYIGDDLFLTMMVRLQTADAGGQPGIVGLTGLSPAFEIGLEWDTPFFILDWSFLPRHPESLFLSDNNLGIRWRISY